MRKIIAGLLALYLALLPAQAGKLLPLLGAGAPFSVSYVSSNSSTSVASSYTFSAQNIGNADSTRIIGLGFVYHLSAGTGNIITGVTIGGSAAAQVASSPANNTLGESSEFWTLAVPAGTSANIVVNTSANLSRIAMCVFSVVGPGTSVSGGASNFSNVSVTTLTQTITIPATGAALSITDIHSATPGTVTPTNLINDTSVTAGSSTAICGHNSSSSGSTSVGQSWTSSTDAVTSAVGFNP